MSSVKVKYKRLFNLELPAGRCAFIWGPRQAGKSTYLKDHYPKSFYIDLLKTDNFLEYSKRPYILREQIGSLSAEEKSEPIIIDEIQKVPKLLDEVHWLTENQGIGFILCGSSARKMKRNAANLLGGRAWVFHFFPLCSREIPDFNLLRSLQNGLLPSIYPLTPALAHRSLKSYVEAYITEEVKGEGLTRNLPAFARFMESLAYSHGEITNFTNISREVGVDSKTVQEYYNILVDTLLGYFVTPFRKRANREIIKSAPKFYLMDVGIANYICNRKIEDLKGSDAGKALEHFILLEIMAYSSINEKDTIINYWRTKSGLEVDFVLDKGKTAIEVKISKRIEKSDLTGLFAFAEEHQPKNIFLVCQEPKKRQIEHLGHLVQIIPISEFLDKLWNDEVI